MSVQTGLNWFFKLNKSMQLQPTRYKFLRQPNRKKKQDHGQYLSVPHQICSELLRTAQIQPDLLRFFSGFRGFKC